MTTGGSGGFETGADYVAAKVSIDVDGAGIQSLREMSQEIDRLRTSTEAGARSSASFTGYIQQMAQAAKQAVEAHRDLGAQLERTAEMQMRGAASGPGSSQSLTSSRVSPGAFVDPFSGMGSGGAGMGGQRGPSPTDVQAQIDPTRQLDPRKYINAQAGRYNINPGDMPSSPGSADWGSHANRVAERDRAVSGQQRATSPSQQAGGGQSGPEEPSPGGGGGGRLSNYAGYGRLASNIANEMSPGGGSWGGMGRVLQGGARGLAKHLDARATGTGAEPAEAAAEGGAEAEGGMGLGSLLGKAGIAGGIGLAGLAAVQKGGAMYQGYKNMGMIRGQGAQAGMGDEAAIRTMALNPFLSTEQSRQIIMAGLTEGYSGKQFDSVTSFMADNLKNMNVSVSDSVQMLRKNVNEGGQSITGLAASLSVLKGLAGQGGNAMSMPDMVSSFQQTSGSLITGGMGGGAAAQEAIQGMGVFGDDQTLKGSFNQDLAGVGTAMGGAQLRALGGANGQVPAGLNPEATAMYMADQGQSAGQDLGAAYLKIYQRAFANPNAKKPGSKESYNALVMFKHMMAIYYPNNPAAQSLDAAKDLVSKLSGGQNPFDQGKQKANSVESEVNTVHGASPGELVGAAWNTLVDGGKQIAAMATGNDSAYDNAGADSDRSWSNYAYHATANAQNPVMDNVIGQLGAGNVQVVDGSGRASDLDGSQGQMQGLAKGDLKWRQKGSTGGGYTLQQTPAMGNVVPGGSQTNVSFSPAQVQITVNSDGSASVSPNPVQLSPNAAQAQAGYGSATMNNAPPGDGNGYDKGKNIQ